MDKKDNIERINTKIASGFEKIEKKLAEAKDVAELFETLFTGVEEEFNVPFVWLTIADTKKNLSFIETAKSSEFLKDRLNIVKPAFFKEIFSTGLKPVLVNKNLTNYYRLFPEHKKYFVKSLALVPFKVNGELTASWNNGDAVQSRYTPDMETNLLQKLSRSLSARLDELI
ncbi:MAG: hypothetical protein JW925_05355 [Syntrophaceae bacterium]|nr:hypothetical protein [Syntrophaceae bacterium]